MAPSWSISRRRFLAAVGVLALTPAIPLAACGTDSDDSSGGSSEPIAEPTGDLTTGVLPTDPHGLLTSAALFAGSPAVIVIDDSTSEDAVATSCAAAREHGVPVLRRAADNSSDVDAEIDRLGAEHVLSPDDDWPDSLGAGSPGDLDGIALISPQTGDLAWAVAVAAGLDDHSLPTADPRATDDSIDAVTADTDRPVIALGDAFGSDDDLTRRIDLAATVTTRLAGGGGVLFPGRRMIALYGHSSGPDLGALGQQDAAASVDRVTGLADEYRDISDVPVVPTFEIIVTVASGEPGPVGTFTNHAGFDEIRPLLDAIVDAGGYAILDLQPGRETLLEQAQAYQELLAGPQVGLALDPEWKLGPEDMPMDDIGHVSAAEINEVVDWLDSFVAERELPQKLLVVHQFQTGMITERENMSAGTDHVSVAVHCDGHGTDWIKTDTWNAVREGLDPDIALGWKNFYLEDSPMFTPQQTMDVDPSPVIVTYQ